MSMQKHSAWTGSKVASMGDLYIARSEAIALKSITCRSLSGALAWTWYCAEHAMKNRLEEEEREQQL